MTASSNDCLAIAANMRKARQNWDLYVKDIGPGGGGCQDLWHLLNVGSEGSANIRIRDVGDDPLYWINPGGFHHRVD